MGRGPDKCVGRYRNRVATSAGDFYAAICIARLARVFRAKEIRAASGLIPFYGGRQKICGSICVYGLLNYFPEASR